MIDLEGKTALVTGGGSGIGRALCQAWADSGMNVVVADVEESRAREVATELGGGAIRTLAVQCDVSDPAAVKELANAAYSEFGAVNVLCNNAGVVQFGPVCDAPLEDWEWLFAVNFWGVVHCIREFVPRMRFQGSDAHIVNTSSLSGVFAVPGLGVYTAAKYGVMAISETMRMELAREGIGVSVLCPGPTPTRIGETARFSMPEGASLVGDPDSDLTYLSTREPAQVAECVRRAVLENRLYVFSHPAGRITTEKRFQAMLQDFEAAPS